VDKIKLAVICFLLGAAIVFTGGFVYVSGELGNRDKELGEYSRVVGELRADHTEVKLQAGKLGSSIESIRIGIIETKGIAGKATEQSGSVTAALKKLVGALTAIQAGIANMERDYVNLSDKYRDLLGALDNQVTPD